LKRSKNISADIRRDDYDDSTDGQWTSLTKAQFTASGAKWEAKTTVDAGAAGDRFYLQTGGDTTTHNKLKSEITRKEGKVSKPELPAEIVK
jgi:hypothetical protein